jgi:hypothetical protein
VASELYGICIGPSIGRFPEGSNFRSAFGRKEKQENFYTTDMKRVEHQSGRNLLPSSRLILRFRICRIVSNSIGRKRAEMKTKPMIIIPTSTAQEKAWLARSNTDHRRLNRGCLLIHFGRFSQNQSPSLKKRARGDFSNCSLVELLNKS